MESDEFNKLIGYGSSVSIGGTHTGLNAYSQEDVNFEYEWQRRRSFAVVRCREALWKLSGERLDNFLKDFDALLARFKEEKIPLTPDWNAKHSWERHVPQRIQSLWATFDADQQHAIREWAEKLDEDVEERRSESSLRDAG